MSTSLSSMTTQPGADAGLLSTFDTVNDVFGDAALDIDPSSNVLRVGIGETYSTLSAAVSAAHDGDVILVDAGTYTNDFATVTAKITIVGVGGMANFVATEPPTNLKGILTVDNDVTIKNLSFSGAAIDAADGGNAAGIRYEGGKMTLINDEFSDNQNGLLAFPVISSIPTNTISITDCVFDGNGSGTGYTHNMYVGAVSSLAVTDSVFENAVVGHEFKSRAETNVINDNVFSDGPTGTASYSIDLPNGGSDTVTDNLIEKGPDAENDASVHFGGEGIPYAGSSLTLSGNEFVNDLGSQAVAVLNQTPFTATVTGNTFTNYTPSQIADGPAAETGNVDGNGTAFTNSTLVGVLPGSTLVITDDAAHSVTLDGTLQAVEGGAGYLTAFAAGAHVIAIGGSGGMSYSENEGSGGNSISTAAGSTNTITVSGQDLIDSEGNDTITTGTDNITGQINGNALVNDGDASNQWAVNGTAIIRGNGGDPTIAVGPEGDATITGPLDYLALSNNGGMASFDIVQGGAEEAMTIIGGAVNVRVYNATINATTAGGSQGSYITLGAGDASITSVGPDTILAGSGNDSVIVSGAATIYAGTGTLSVYGHGDEAGATIYGNGGTVTLDGDTGNLTYYGGSQDNTVQSLLSGDTLIGGTGHMTVNGGSRETITGGAGGITYSGADGGGANTITTAAGSFNILDLAGADTIQSWGDDTINGGTGNQSIVVNGNATINGSTGTSDIKLNGTDTLNGVGQDFVTVTAGAVATINAGSLTSVNETGATVNYSVAGGGGAAMAQATVTGGEANLVNTQNGVTVSTTSGDPSTVVLGSGAVTVNSAASDTIYAGAGPDTVGISTANAVVWGGNGDLHLYDSDWTAGDGLTVHGGSGELTYDQAMGTLHFIGGSGTAVINGEYGSLDITAGSGAITITGGNLGTKFTAGTGRADLTLTPGGGDVTFGRAMTVARVASYGAADVFNFNAGSGGGTDVIYGFRAGTDQLDFNGVAASSASFIRGGICVQLTDGTSLRLINSSLPSSLTNMITHR